MELLFLDTETTGNDTAKDRLCQVCYKIGDDVQTELFKPPLPISVKAMSITHITNDMVADKGPFQGSDMHSNLQTLLAQHILVAHNASFDIAILEAEGLSVPQFICTLRLARHLDAECVVPEYNLQFLRYFLGLNVPNAHAHDAQGDVLVLEAVFARLFTKLKEQHGGNEESALEEMLKISRQPSLIRKFNYGKYKGQKLEDVAATDPGYLEWMLNEKTMSLKSGSSAYADNDKEMIHSLKHFLGRTA